MTSTLKLYAIIGLVLAALVGIGVVYGKGRLDASHAAAIENLQQQVDASDAALAQTRKDLAAMEEAARKDQLQAMQDAEDKERLNALIASQSALLSDPHGGCFGPADGDIVRSLFAPSAKTSAPAQGPSPARH